jgi:long-chain acyl-CoA synthetase
MKIEKQSSNAIRVIKIFVFLCDVITYPIYYLIQKPWAVLEKANRIRAKLEDPTDPYSAWVRTGDQPKHYLHECKTLGEAQQKLLLMNGRDKQCLGQREISAEEEEKQPNGKVHKKWTLSDYQWLTIGEVDDRIGYISRGLLVNGVKPKDTVLIFAETRIGMHFMQTKFFNLKHFRV